MVMGVEEVVLVVTAVVGTELVDDVVFEVVLEGDERTTYAATPPTATIITIMAAIRIGAIPPLCRFI